MWSIAKELKFFLDPTIKSPIDIPYTISYCIRKRQQIDNFRELPKEKRPPSKIIWSGTSDDIDEWFDKVFDRDKKKSKNDFVFEIPENMIEG
jgi:hypothetical protein